MLISCLGPCIWQFEKVKCCLRCAEYIDPALAPIVRDRPDDFFTRLIDQPLPVAANLQLLSDTLQYRFIPRALRTTGHHSLLLSQQ